MKQDVFYFWLPFSLLFVLTYYLQMHIYISTDVSYLIYVAHQVLNGGTYGVEVFETNPPMIFYLYAPICLTAAKFGINILTVAKNYFFILAFASSIISFLCLKKIIKPRDRALLYSLSIAVTCTMVFFPVNHFGQREHILLLFILPYIFSTILSLNEVKIKPLSAFFIGCFAGLGLAMKPFFLIPFVFIETYYFLVKKSYFALRVESITIICIVLTYFISIFIYHPNYIYLMLPIIMDLYFPSIKLTWLEIITTPTLHYCICGIFFLFYKTPKDYTHFLNVLILSMFGMVIACIIPRTPWFYHMLPAYSFAVLIWTFYLVQLIYYYIGQYQINFKSTLLLSLITLFVYSVPLYVTCDLFQFYIHSKNKHGKKTRLIQYIKNLPNHATVDCFSLNTTADCFPLVYYTGSQYGGRFPFFWWLRAILRYEKFPKQENLSPHFLNEKNFVFNEMIKDLHNFKNDVIIINTNNVKLVFDERFNFIKYFSQDERFREIWKHYRYIKTLDHYQIYVRQN